MSKKKGVTYYVIIVLILLLRFLRKIVKYYFEMSLTGRGRGTEANYGRPGREGQTKIGQTEFLTFLRTS